MGRFEQWVRPVWAEIDLGAIRHNLREIRRLVGPGVEMMAVVKAEAYGHGAIEVARTALDSGASWLGVAIPEEGVKLRQAGLTAPVLVFGPLQVSQVSVFLEYDLIPTVCTLEAAVALSREAVKIGKVAKVHIKVDTGMNRIGIHYSDTSRFVHKVTQFPGIKITGVYSHLATADHADKELAKLQIKRFTEVISQLKKDNLLPEKVHLANSAAIMDLPNSYFNMVRPGIILYGLTPSTEMSNPSEVNLKPALKLKTRVAFVKKVPPRSGISYGYRYYTKKETTIATIPIGYADGWSRMLTNKCMAMIGGKKYPIVGTICMDQCMVDVGDDPVEIGDEVTLIGVDGDQAITADEIAGILGTINYEVTCMLSDRIQRVYLNQ